MSYRSTCTLIGTETVTRDKYGIPTEHVEYRKVFCESLTTTNRATSTTYAARLKIRRPEYHDETRVIFEGNTYKIASVNKSADWVRLDCADIVGDRDGEHADF